MRFVTDEVHRRLEELAKRDRKRRCFGAAAHDYRLNPPLDRDVVDAFELKHQVALPDDYRMFLTSIGNGGAGPFYGLFPFEHDDDGLWETGTFVGDVAAVFPHSVAWNHTASFWERAPQPWPGISDDDEERLYDEWDALLTAEYWHPSVVNGAIPICHIGCGLYQWLVVHGDERGFVWNDYRADEAGLFPLTDGNGHRMTFSDWYLAWLDEPNTAIPTASDGRS